MSREHLNEGSLLLARASGSMTGFSDPRAKWKRGNPYLKTKDFKMAMAEQ